MQKIDNYEQAISIYPNDTRAYLKLLEAYEQEGVFGKEQNDEFLALYNANREGVTTGSNDCSELNYKIGMMYFNYYVSENGEVQFSERVQKHIRFSRKIMRMLLATSQRRKFPIAIIKSVCSIRHIF